MCIRDRSWMGLVAPRGAPTEAVQAMSNASAKILSSQEYRTALERISMRPTASTPDEFSALLQREHERWSPILRTAGIKLD